MNRPAITLGIVIGITVSVLLLATYILFSAQAGQWGWYMLSLTLAVTGVTTLFGILALPGGLSEDGSYREQRIRFAIAATLLVVYFVLFSNAVLWGAESKDVNKEMMGTLTQLMSIVLPFYFGTSGLVEWGKIREARRNKNTSETD